MASSLAFLAMMATSGVGNGPRVTATQANRMMLAEARMTQSSFDGFGLDAEEYEFLMAWENVEYEDMTGGCSVPTCVSGWQGPALYAPSNPGDNNGDDDSGDDDDSKGFGRTGSFTLVDLSKLHPGTGLVVNGVRPTGWDNPPIGGDLRAPSNPGDNNGDDDSGDDNDSKGFGKIRPFTIVDLSKLHPGTGFVVNGVRPGGLVDPDIGGDLRAPSNPGDNNGDDDSGDDDDSKGFGKIRPFTIVDLTEVRRGTGFVVNGVRPGGYGDPPIGGDLW